MSEPEAEILVQTKNGRLRLGLQFAILGLLSFLTAYFVLWADRHNDERYVRRSDYMSDRQNDERFRDEVTKGVNRRLDDQSKQLDTIGADVKALLRDPRK